LHGRIKDDLLPFVPPCNTIMDILHLLLRAFDRLFMVCCKKMLVVFARNIYTRKKIKQYILEHIRNECGIKFFRFINENDTNVGGAIYVVSISKKYLNY
jgi:hypothetical protein